MTLIEPLRKVRARYRNGGRRGPDARVDAALVTGFVVGMYLLRRQLGRAATERTGTWVGTIR
ncbi:hypothetical protein [Nitriliruptor alkaliphilus]|uniref:hypothetical protein n=1 Tax=Nitriliruptor alkaliphilus TaxID=427918 RepID=UPI0014701FDD|nr:hypothetical protein [Nitriliruptor alkaliphilus]